jgi:hypothetical protein
VTLKIMPNSSRPSCVIPFDMRTLIWLCFALPALLAGQTITGCDHPFEARAGRGHELFMNLRSGDITIAGTTTGMIRVSCSTRHDDDARYLRISYAADHLTVRGGSNDDLQLRIEIPQSTNLIIRGSAGNLTLSGVSGDKDVELNAGNLTIHVGDPADYRRAEASVLAGNILASPFGITKDGLFRSFNRDNPGGKYRVRAHLMAGNLVFE